MTIFTQTCNKPYDRHKYKLFYSNGKVETYTHYEDVIRKWITTDKEILSHVEVIDKKNKSNGFK